MPESRPAWRASPWHHSATTLATRLEHVDGRWGMRDWATTGWLGGGSGVGRVSHHHVPRTATEVLPAYREMTCASLARDGRSLCCLGDGSVGGCVVLSTATLPRVSRRRGTTAQYRRVHRAGSEVNQTPLPYRAFSAKCVYGICLQWCKVCLRSVAGCTSHQHVSQGGNSQQLF